MSNFFSSKTDVNEDFWNKFGQQPPTSAYGSSDNAKTSEPAVEYDLLTNPNEPKPSVKSSSDDVDLEAWLNDDSSTTIKAEESKSKSSVKTKQSDGSWGGWDESGWEEINDFNDAKSD